MLEAVIVSAAVGALLGFVTGEVRGYALGKRARPGQTRVEPATPIRYADNPENRGRGMLYWRVTCHRCLKYGEWETSRTIHGSTYDEDTAIAKDVGALGFAQVERVWFCNECAQDVRSYALETLA